MSTTTISKTGVTPLRWRKGCTFPHDRDHRCYGCAETAADPFAGAAVTPELRITADQPVHPYLIQLHRGGTLLAYAVRGSYGWAICARTLLPRRRRATSRTGIATIGRTGHDRYAVETALLLVAAARGGAR